MELNDLAIVLTKKIERNLVKAFLNQKHPPSFFNIRENILEVLQENITILQVQTTESPEMMREMRPNRVEEYKNDQIKRATYQVIESIFESPDYFNKFIFEDDWDHFRKTTHSIAVVKTAKIVKEANKVKP